jgi:hypothetical protein
VSLTEEPSLHVSLLSDNTHFLLPLNTLFIAWDLGQRASTDI